MKILKRCVKCSQLLFPGTLDINLYISVSKLNSYPTKNIIDSAYTRQGQTRQVQNPLLKRVSSCLGANFAVVKLETLFDYRERFSESRYFGSFPEQ